MRDGSVSWRSALPKKRAGRWLLAMGALVLLALVPVLWAWVLYASGYGKLAVSICALGISSLAAAIGLAMIRALDRR